MRRPIHVLLVVAPLLPSAAAAALFDTGEQREGYRRIVSPPMSVLLQGAVEREDGMLVIHPGRHGAEANAYHQALCAAYGGTDETDRDEVVFSPQGGDSYRCKLAAPPLEEPEFVRDISVDEEGRIYRWVPMDPKATRGQAEPRTDQSTSPGGQESTPAPSALRIDPHAAQSRVPRDRQYRAYSWVDFLDVPFSAQFSVDSTVLESNPCQWHQSGRMDPGPGMKIGGTPTCMADRTQGVRSWIRGCHASVCNTDEQWVLHQ